MRFCNIKQAKKELFNFKGVNYVGEGNGDELVIGFLTKEDRDTFVLTEYKGFPIKKLENFGEIIPYGN